MMAAVDMDSASDTGAARDKLLRPVLRTLNSVSPDIEASAVITSDGLTIAAVLVTASIATASGDVRLAPGAG